MADMVFLSKMLPLRVVTIAVDYLKGRVRSSIFLPDISSLLLLKVLLFQVLSLMLLLLPMTLLLIMLPILRFIHWRMFQQK